MESPQANRVGKRGAIVPVETYSVARKAEFLLSNAVNSADYRKARKAVKELGLDPDAIPHQRPS